MRSFKMKYMIIKSNFMEQDITNILVTNDEDNFISFPAEIGNPNYDQFLVQVDLTDDEVHALPLNEWIEA